MNIYAIFIYLFPDPIPLRAGGDDMLLANRTRDRVIGIFDRTENIYPQSRKKRNRRNNKVKHSVNDDPCVCTTSHLFRLFLLKRKAGRRGKTISLMYIQTNIRSICLTIYIRKNTIRNQHPHHSPTASHPLLLSMIHSLHTLHTILTPSLTPRITTIITKSPPLRFPPRSWCLPRRMHRMILHGRRHHHRCLLKIIAVLRTGQFLGPGSMLHGA